MCNYCNIELYMKTKQCMRPMLAPLTPADELRDKLMNLTGELYLPITKQYCAMCGNKFEKFISKID